MRKAFSLMITVVMVTACIAGSLVGCSGSSPASTSASDAPAVSIAPESTADSSTSVAPSASAAVDELTKKLETIPDDDLYIGISLTTMADEYMITFAENFKAYADPRGIKYEIQGADSSAITQISQIENMLTQGINTLFLWAVERESVKDVMSKAKESGVYVISGSSGLLEAGVADCWVGVSQWNYGYGATEMASDWINEHYPDAGDKSVEVCVFSNPSSSAFTERQMALLEIEKLNSKAKVVDEYNLAGETNLQAKCQEYAEIMITNHPDVKIIICHSSSFALAVDEVLMRSTNLDTSDVAIFAIDYLEAAANAIINSETGSSCIRGFTITDVENNAEIPFYVATREILPDEESRVLVGVKKVTINNVQEVIEAQQAQTKK